MAPPTSTLPSSHPLIAELTSLRQQLTQYQKSGHQSAIQLQGAKLELNLAKDESTHLREANDTLRSELQILRTHPLPPTQPPTSTALAELTLAHRRLSTKLDLTEQALQSSQLELASCKQEIARLGKEREGDRAIINELRRGDEEREEEIAWERGERRKAEELKRLCDLAIDDYKDLVRSLDPNAVPPSEPKEIVMPVDLISSPDKSLPALPPTSPEKDSESTTAQESTAAIISTPSPTIAQSTSSSTTASAALSGPEAISNLLIGQRGVNRLFEDFTQTLSTRDKEIHQLKDRLEEIEHTLSTITEQLDQETTLRISVESQRDAILRDDASAAKVVERYMTFTQKTHATVHLHLDNLRARAAATQLSLRKELVHTQSRLVSETERAERLRLALDEASENLQREVGGRRREVGLRLKMISNEERRERRIEIWLDRVRRQRDGVEGAVLEADILESLLDEGIEAYNLDSKPNTTTGQGQLASKDKQRSWKGILGRKRGISNATTLSDGGEAASIARVLLAEELVDTLVKDLQIETERRMALEGERVEWLAKEAIEGREAGEIGAGENDGHEDGVMFDLDQHEHEHEHEADGDGNVKEDEAIKVGDGDKDIPGSAEEEVLDDSLILPLETPLIPLETPPPLEPTPTLTRLSTIFTPLLESHKPLQSSLNALSHSLSDIRDSLPIKRNLIRRTPLQDPVLLSILENLHESLEDARVDVEIAIADEDRVYRGFEALLGVGLGGVVQSSSVFEDAREFVAFKLNEGWTKLNGKVGDLEMDLSTVKSKIHELEGMDLSYDEEPTSPSLSRTGSNANVETPSLKPKSIWNTLDLKTVTLAPTTPVPEGGRRRLGQGVFGGVSSVGRSFSASVISAPRKVGGFAGGLYKPRNKKSEEVGLIQDNDKGDDVE